MDRYNFRSWRCVIHTALCDQVRSDGIPVLLSVYSRFLLAIRRVWRYQMGNQNPYSEEEQTTQWPKEKVQKDKQRSIKHRHKTKD